MTLSKPVITVPVHVAFDFIQQSSTLSDALANVELALLGLGFDRFVVLDRRGSLGPRVVHHNAPGAWAGTARQLEQNPIIQRVIASPIPFTWDRSTYQDSQADDQWQELARHGFVEGLCASCGPADRRSCIVVTTKDGGQVASDALYEVYGMLLLIAGACLAALDRLAPVEEAPSVKLRPREVECLYWAFQSKTAWETSQILGISERMVNQHLARARQQLDAPNTQVAATKAFQLQLLPRTGTA